MLKILTPGVLALAFWMVPQTAQAQSTNMFGGGDYMWYVNLQQQSALFQNMNQSAGQPASSGYSGSAAGAGNAYSNEEDLSSTLEALEAAVDELEQAIEADCECED